jgi:hypothetical protein
MDYAEGGTLWDVLESSPHGGGIPESDLKWWAPQIISNIVLLKNEFGNVQVNSKLAQQSSLTAVSKILNGCM